ncbi:uncharacterized protein LOC126764092 [Bactrocera neohumeralis]|uniref:uncharacterized protein LOC120780501 n=1 Tax=Bactrocera tryoni TaxID=59916 RepID=UPI001A97B87A|nr:uncharacterized protein LOC120780501 [Bactrocera tryoni]XP_050337834.1 uncharacterized protein LOC126764092 [Bactrocera neohumeralis]
MKSFFILIFTYIIAISQITRCKNSNYYTMQKGEYLAENNNKNLDTKISNIFYKSGQDAEIVKIKLQNTLRNFLENLQKNLTTSIILKTLDNKLSFERSQQKWQKLNDHMDFYRTASRDLQEFSFKSEMFLQISKNESVTFLMKLRRVPTGQQMLAPHVKLQLTNYFAEMEFFNVVFFEILDEGMEYINNALYIIRTTFENYADIQQKILRDEHFLLDNWCFNKYFEFLQKWSTQIYKCATETRLQTVYNVFSITKVAVKYLMQQLEFKMQRLFNCFICKEYSIKCNFLRFPENDFEKLFNILKELQIYYDIEINRGRVESRRIQRSENIIRLSEKKNVNASKKNCLPFGFPTNQMRNDLKVCFNIH